VILAGLEASVRAVQKRPIYGPWPIRLARGLLARLPISRSPSPLAGLVGVAAHCPRVYGPSVFRRERGTALVRLDTFAYAYVFALAMSLVRFAWASW